MKPYIQYNGKKIYLPQEVNANKFEMNVLEHGDKTLFLLCPKVNTRYIQATGAAMVQEGNEMKFTYKGRKLAQGSFPIGVYKTFDVQIDYKAAAANAVSMESMPDDSSN